MIDKVQADVESIKKLHSKILENVQTDDSKFELKLNINEFTILIIPRCRDETRSGWLDGGHQKNCQQSSCKIEGLVD